MLLWLSLCVISVIAENTIQPPAEENQMKQYSCNSGEERVLLKIWTVLSNLLDADGTVKVPSRDQVQYGLTILKKYILENQGHCDVDLQEKLFLREAELAKYKGVFLNDDRPLQSLLELELIPNNDDSKLMFKYELPANNNPRCRDEFIKLIRSAHEDHIRLVNSPVCNDANVEAYLSNPNGPFNFQSSLYTNPYNIINNLEFKSFNSKHEYNNPTTQNLKPVQTYVKEISEETQKPSRAESGLNNPIASNVQRIVKLTKDRVNIFGEDFIANLEHAKNVAEKIKALYQENNMPKDMPVQVDSTREYPLHVKTNYGSVNIDVQNQHPKPVLQASYLNQNNNLPRYIRNPGENQTYTVTNILQSQSTVVENSYTSPKPMFINSKYHPNPRYNYDGNWKIMQNNPKPNLEDFQRKTYSNPTNINLLYKYSTPYNIVANSPSKTEINRQPNSNNFNYNYNIYRYPKPNYAESSKAFQNDYPYQPSSNPYRINVTYYPNFVQKVNMPQQKTLNNDPIQNYKYTSLSHVQNHNVPNQLTQPLNYNNQPVIDKLADFIAGTNPTKLNSNINNDQGEIELTYLVKEPPPVLYNPKISYIKFRLPYKDFARHMSDFLAPHSRLRSSDVDLYKDLESQFNATVIPSDLSQIPKEDTSNLEDKRLVSARYINPNLPGNDDNLKSVEIFNLIKQVELKNANEASPVNDNETPNPQIPPQPLQQS